MKVIIYLIILSGLIFASSKSWASCSLALEQTLIPYKGDVSTEDISITFDFDCKESHLIDALNLPYRDSSEKMAQILDFLELLPFQFIENSLEVLSPYCRNEESWFGHFCMAGDVDSAKLITNRQDLINKLPKAVLLISKAVDQQNKFNLIEVLRPLFDSNQEREDL